MSIDHARSVSPSTVKMPVSVTWWMSKFRPPAFFRLVIGPSAILGVVI